jgi:hypothetical protein
MRKMCEEGIKERNKIIEEKLKKKEENFKIIEKLKKLLAMKVIKRKTLQMKNLSLEHSIKTGEAFVLSLDKFFSNCLQGKNL